MTPTRTTKRAARTALLSAATLTEYPGATPVFGETVAAALALSSAVVTDFGAAGIVVQPFGGASDRRYVIATR